ncbi:hypothetical protein KFK09_010227 [Dendrobium nobile]|uniref:Uncharacterized protein n=1 Tax=Dendrobium nobile TaxID=94219 RepID=A0A8T3BLK4_DENNO|nr:hypothetical protein KFK09_010227 [Dendrobium nobile]
MNTDQGAFNAVKVKILMIPPPTVSIMDHKEQLNRNMEETRVRSATTNIL